MFFFQTPLAEMAVRVNDFAFIDRLWAEWSPGYTLPDEERAALKAMFAQEGVVEAALAYYRQVFTPSAVKPEWAEPAAAAAGPISVPTLYLHGRDDGCMAASLSNGMEALFSGGFRRVLVDDAGHFLHLEQPQKVNDEIVRFLKGQP